MKNYKELQNGSDIRGIALEGRENEHINLTGEAAADLARGFAHWLSEKTGKPLKELRVAVGTDSRVTASKFLLKSCTALAGQGVQVLCCNMASTPAMYMATVFPETDCDGAIMLTASHLPCNRNGMKFFTKQSGLEKADISELISLAEGFANVDDGISCQSNIKEYELIERYSAHLRAIIKDALSKGSEPESSALSGSGDESGPLSGLHVVVDAGNGAGGFYALNVLKALGADISGSQFLEPDGTFPNHEPNPENKEAMASISKAVRESNADLGIIFDTDVDRAAAVDSRGREIARNAIVALAASLVAEDFPGSTVVTDSITSTQLGDFLRDRLGMKHYRYKRGYRNVIRKGMELEDCHLAIETSGHAAIKENYWLDDGAFLATKIVIKAKQLKDCGRHIDELLSELKEPLEARELRIKVKAENFAEYAGKVLDEFELDSDWSLEEPNYEGIRVDTDCGWFLLRKSLHDHILPLNIESDAAGGADKMEKRIREKLAKYDELEI